MARRYYDAQPEQHYNYFRDYDPSTGRYIESDPIGLAGGLNTYAYVGGNPLRFVDPFGLSGKKGTDLLFPKR
ncbi:MAG: RHS repeat-associated core domain-containing protein [Gammaproteobacteria bacterium]|nr:RHS repeat-associated core domain-containing protein [Gammaproteobacteria bacterium]